ncbi:MAG: bifunctional phosphopantothenoylcysteine decarboxylase/phosphopantothenate--cysteine ligase CoaBC [Cyanobacteria bacterium K_DeepCast_35m_m2_023]|nr:bifunctional phosphopantothenoylcysteine decarboxylase/phosphopantothenate--cysteine ligase CoaBC [Cyanobacteria bacterium K_DeepCast_35m_m2_023]
MRTESSAPAAAAAAVDALAGRRVLVAITGSIAAVKLPLVVSALVKRGAQVRCVLTPSAERLVSPVALASLSRHRCYLDSDQWSASADRPLHIALAEWAELVLVAPLSATSLARWMHGLADTLLASTLLASEAPVLAAAAMNTSMWLSAPVQRNWQQMHCCERVLPLGPAAGLLACDRVGDGRMAEPAMLLLALESLHLWGWRRDWLGRRLLVTAGPTREPLDPARCITNPSTGRMGVLLAQAARLRGAEVDLVHGPLNLDLAWLEGLRCHAAPTAAQMQQALAELQGGADAIAMAAAVADHRRAHPAAVKASKGDLGASLTDGWEAVPDLLAELVARRQRPQPILGFAAQSGDVLTKAQAKHRRKGCELLFANPIDQSGSGFAALTNQGWLLGPGDGQRSIAPASKLAIAHELLSALAALMEEPGFRPPEGDLPRCGPAAADP